MPFSVKIRTLASPRARMMFPSVNKDLLIALPYITMLSQSCCQLRARLPFPLLIIRSDAPSKRKQFKQQGLQSVVVCLKPF